MIYNIEKLKNDLQILKMAAVDGYHQPLDSCIFDVRIFLDIMQYEKLDRFDFELGVLNDGNLILSRISYRMILDIEFDGTGEYLAIITDDTDIQERNPINIEHVKNFFKKIESFI